VRERSKIKPLALPTKNSAALRFLGNVLDFRNVARNKIGRAMETAFNVGWAALERVEDKTSELLDEADASRAGNMIRNASKLIGNLFPERTRRNLSIAGVGLVATALMFVACSEQDKLNEQEAKELACKDRIFVYGPTARLEVVDLSDMFGVIMTEGENLFPDGPTVGVEARQTTREYPTALIAGEEVCLNAEVTQGPGANLTPRNEGVDGTVIEDPEFGG
jgi:hypothetical protein